MKYCLPRELNTDNQLFQRYPTLEDNTDINHSDSGYTVKYSPLPLGAPSGKQLYLTVPILSCPNQSINQSMYLNSPIKTDFQRIEGYSQSHRGTTYY